MLWRRHDKQRMLDVYKRQGMVPVTVVAVIITGIMGSIMAPWLIRIFRVSDSMTAGLAIGA